MTHTQFCRFDGIFMHQHPELYGWWKCSICAYCKLEKPMITLEIYLMGRDKDPRYKGEYNNEIEENAKTLLDKVNALLSELGIKDVVVSSGWRPAAVNAATSGSAKHSLHMTGKAVDIKDDGTLYNKILDKPEILKKFGLWMEDKSSTPTWVHLDWGNRSDRPIRTFKP